MSDGASLLDSLPLLDIDADFFVSPSSPVTAVGCSSQLCVIGTAEGTVQVLLHDGTPVILPILRRLGSAITAVSIDSTSGAFCSLAGASGEILIVSGVLTETPEIVYLDPLPAIYRPLNDVAICPDYSASIECMRIVAGGASGDLIVLSQQGAPFPPLSVSRTNSEGPVMSVEWHDEHLVWAGPNAGVKCINTRSSQKICHVPFKCSKIVFLSKRKYLIFSNFSILVFHLLDKGIYEVCEILAVLELPIDQFAPNSEIGSLMGSTRHQISGFGLFDESELSLCLVTRCGAEVCHHVIDTATKDIPVSDFIQTIPSSTDEVVYTHSAGSSGYSIVAAGTRVTKITKRSIGENSLWLIERGRFEEALELSRLSPDPGLRQYVANRAVAPLIEARAFARAASLVSRLGLDEADKWSKFIDLFVSIETGPVLAESLTVLVKVIPVPPMGAVVLHKVDYERVIESLIRNVEFSFFDLLQTVRKWPIDLYNATVLKDTLIDMVPEDFVLDAASKAAYLPRGIVGFPGTDTVSDPTVRTVSLMLTLKVLYDELRRFEDSLDILIRLNCASELLTLLTNHMTVSTRQWFEINLLSVFQSDPTAAAKFTVKQHLVFPTSSVCEELTDHPFLLHVYLRELFGVNPSATTDYQAKQVDLFTQFDKPLLANFLRTATEYNPTDALSVVQAARLHARGIELVEAEALLLWKLGRNRDAVELLLDVSQDIETAVKFLSTVDDPDLWSAVQSRVSANQNRLVVPFLQSLLTIRAINPQGVMAEDVLLAIEPGVRGKGLPGTALQVLQRQSLMCAIEARCANIVRNDWEVSRCFATATNRAVLVNPSFATCRVCGCMLTSPPPGGADGDEMMTDSMPGLSSIPLHVRKGSTLAVISGSELVHSTCLIRTAVENYFPT